LYPFWDVVEDIAVFFAPGNRSQELGLTMWERLPAAIINMIWNTGICPTKIKITKQR